MAAKLSVKTIVDEAFALLDEAGIDGLTLRALADRLGVKAPALYWHVPSKQALLDEMGTEVARRISERSMSQPFGESFASALSRYAATVREEYLAHRDGARTFAGTRLRDPELLRRQEIGLAHWTERGIPLERIVDAYDVVTAFVVGFVIEEQDRQDAQRYSLADRDKEVGAENALAVAAGHHGFRPAQQRFDDQLSFVVAGLS